MSLLSIQRRIYKREKANLKHYRFISYISPFMNIIDYMEGGEFMDKLFFEMRKKGELSSESGSSGGASTILFALCLLCVSLLFFNLSLVLKQGENDKSSKLENALLAFADEIEENEAVCAFLGIEDAFPSEDEIY